MTRKDFLEKAYSGGWRPTDRHYQILEHTDLPDGFEERAMMQFSAVLLDVEAWKAVGKVSGWGIRDEEDIRNGGYLEEDEWLINMHRMVDFLAEGRTIEEFISSL